MQIERPSHEASPLWGSAADALHGSARSARGNRSPVLGSPASAMHRTAAIGSPAIGSPLMVDLDLGLSPSVHRTVVRSPVAPTAVAGSLSSSSSSGSPPRRIQMAHRHNNGTGKGAAASNIASRIVSSNHNSTSTAEETGYVAGTGASTGTGTGTETGWSGDAGQNLSVSRADKSAVEHDSESDSALALDGVRGVSPPPLRSDGSDSESNLPSLSGSLRSRRRSARRLARLPAAAPQCNASFVPPLSSSLLDLSGRKHGGNPALARRAAARRLAMAAVAGGGGGAGGGVGGGVGEERGRSGTVGRGDGAGTVSTGVGVNKNTSGNSGSDRGRREAGVTSDSMDSESG